MPGAGEDIAHRRLFARAAAIDPVRAIESVHDPWIDAREQGRAERFHGSERMSGRHRERNAEELRPALHVEDVVLRLRGRELREEPLRSSDRAEDATEEHRLVNELCSRPPCERRYLGARQGKRTGTNSRRPENGAPPLTPGSLHRVAGSRAAAEQGRVTGSVWGPRIRADVSRSSPGGCKSLEERGGANVGE